jgi:hypothetical protein
MGSGHHVAKALPLQVLHQEIQNLVRILVWDQTEIQLGLCLVGQNGLGTFPGVTGPQAADISGWLEQILLQQGETGEPIVERCQAQLTATAFLVKGHPLQRRPVRNGRCLNPIIEAGDEHPPLGISQGVQCI